MVKQVLLYIPSIYIYMIITRIYNANESILTSQHA